MSYDLEVRADAGYSKTVALDRIGSIVGSFPGVAKISPTSFVLSRLPAGIHVNIDLFHQTEEDQEAVGEPATVNSAWLTVSYSLLAKSGPVALEMAFQMAEQLDWTVWDPQGDCDLSRASSARALAIQESSGAAARHVLEAAANAEASLGEVFFQEMWNHGLVVAVISFVGVAALSIGLMFTWEWPKDSFDKYLPWAVTIGGLGVLWIKAFVQAVLRVRRYRAASTER